ncbi:MAG: hypothetical protein AAGD33_01975 [Actinomycetota bacterium]
MPELILHIGTHKTGTTTVQRFLAANRDRLRDRGTWYPPAELGGFPPHYAHHAIAHAIAERPGAGTRNDATRFFSAVKRKSRAGERCLISAEPMYRHLIAPEGVAPSTRGIEPDEYSERVRRYATAVRECSDGFDVKILVMFRRQDLFVESLYAEQILATGYTRQIEAFVGERQNMLDYRARVEDWASVFGADALSIDVFESSLRETPIERRFLDWVGAPWDDDLTTSAAHNVTPPRALVEFKRFVNDPHQGAEVSTKLRRWIEQLATLDAADTESRLPDLGRYYLRPRDRISLIRDVEADNSEIAQRYLGRPNLFTDEVLDDLAGYVDRVGLRDIQFRELTKRLVHLATREVLEADA